MKNVNPFVGLLSALVLIFNFLAFESQLGSPLVEHHRITRLGFQDYTQSAERRGYHPVAANLFAVVTYPGAVAGALLNNALLPNSDH